jgi:hypothetical protein
MLEASPTTQGQDLNGQFSLTVLPNNLARHYYLTSEHLSTNLGGVNMQ